MIRYPIDLSEIESRVDAQCPATARRPSWRDRARHHIDAMRQAGGYSEGPSWSEVKPVFREIQHHKCAYCERKLPSTVQEAEKIEAIGAGEHAIEHYRPKNAVKPWPEKGGFPFPLNDGCKDGYYLLSVQLGNYCVSCETCNSELKGNYFPIEGAPAASGDEDISAMNAAEKPMLLYPLGNGDDDPAKVISFEGLAPVPMKKSGRLHRRARVNIRFFRMAERDDLLRERAIILRLLFRALRDLASDDQDTRAAAEQDLRHSTDPSAAHSSFAVSFIELFRKRPADAGNYFKQAGQYLDTGHLDKTPPQ